MKITGTRPAVIQLIIQHFKCANYDVLVVETIKLKILCNKIIVDSSEDIADNDPADTDLIRDSQTNDADAQQIQENSEEFHPVEQELPSAGVVNRETVSTEEEKFMDAEAGQESDFVSQSTENLVNEQLHQNREMIQKRDTDGGERSEAGTNEPEPAEVHSETGHLDSEASQVQIRSTIPDLHNQEAISDNVTNEIIETVTTSVRNNASTLPQEDDTVLENAETNHEIPSETNDDSQETIKVQGEHVETKNELTESSAPSNHMQSKQPVEHNVQVCFEREVKVVETQPKVETIQVENDTTESN